MIRPQPNLVVMAGGASSRMKKSLRDARISPEIATTAAKVHKALIPLGKSKRPLIARLLTHAQKAGYTRVYLIVADHDTAFQQWWKQLPATDHLKKLQLYFAFQSTPKNREKPLGTADALYQAMLQYPHLQQSSFTVCNGDNLYGIESLQQLLARRSAPNALIAYDREGLQYPAARIAQFALLQMDAQGFLKGIVEKPKLETLENFRDTEGKLRVSMNIFSLQGDLLFSYFRDCPIDHVRQEKELPQAIINYLHEYPKKIKCFFETSNVPDLTIIDDTISFSDN